jgi:hypothetical protein
MFSYISAEQRVPKDHPLRAIPVMVDAALRELSWRFDAVYATSERLHNGLWARQPLGHRYPLIRIL